jgi:hypothetical protein
MMAERFSENENKVFVMTLTRPCKSDPNHRKAWKSGRAKVARFVFRIFQCPTQPFFPFLLLHHNYHIAFYMCESKALNQIFSKEVN